MNNIVVAFPKAEVAKNVKKILAQSGYSVTAVCTTGAQALSSMSDLQSGIVVCGYRFVDMMYTEVYEYMPAGFQMLLIASADGVRDRGVENLVSLSMPLKIPETDLRNDGFHHHTTEEKAAPKTKGQIRERYADYERCQGSSDGTKRFFRGGSP